MSDLLWLSESDVASLVGIEESIPLVERAFAEMARGTALMPAKVYLDLSRWGGDLRAMPACLTTEDGSFAGVKVVNSHPANPAKGLPAVAGILVLNDPATGMPLALMAAGVLTERRTGAAGAVAAKHLARPDSAVLGLVGCGRQAGAQWRAIRTLFPLKEIRVAGLTPAEAEGFLQRESKDGGGIVFRAAPLPEVCAADIVVTTTPSRAPVVKADWVRPGAHVNAVGADAPGKRELETALLKRARVFVDSREQAFHSGEVNVPLSQGEMSPADVAGELGAVIAGTLPGRRSAQEITVFDSTGLAVQDIAVAARVYKKALSAGRGVTLPFQ
jgi:alanine dehydrogenase